ncbi:bicyclomycin resistance protein [Penicillium daleae]|uniref:Bicyclomycin resistance protein n=1 Tax=Penicillium daleae TaxID=63821 RepID=A0AAD6C2X4_9EURO|nr:bicyclomycin resistance protein [Penicillium daleae]KAJ5444678.1 bicyclomycin resistance protein [Penicillium daleae]
MIARTSTLQAIQLNEKTPFWNFGSRSVPSEILHHRYPGSGSEDDPYAVSWLPIDPQNPMQFTLIKKVTITFVTAFACFIVSLSSSAYAGSTHGIMVEFGISKELATAGLSLFVFGFSVGPLIWAPLSESIGRQSPFLISLLGLAAFSGGCAGAQNIQMLLVMRFFGGSFGSSPLTNASGVISDMFTARQRGLALLSFASTPYLGPCLGPIIGGFLEMKAGWRWVEGFLSAIAALAWVLMLFFVPETYAPVILRRRAKKLSCLTGKCHESKLDLQIGKSATITKRLKTVGLRPWMLLLREPIVLFLTIYAALIYGTLYMLFEALPIVYEDYRGWNKGVGSLPFIGVMIGVFCGVIYSLYDNQRYTKMQHQCTNGDSPAPEARLPPCMAASLTIPAGLFWFAWTNSPSVHWLVSVASLISFGFGLLLVYMGIVSYLIDTYTIYSASVMAGMSVFRFVFGAAFPLFSNAMYERLGIHWASCIPAFLSVLCMPLPFLIYKYGPEIRKRCKYAALAEKHLRTVREIVVVTEHAN